MLMKVFFIKNFHDVFGAKELQTLHPWKRIICCTTCHRVLTFLPNEAPNVVKQFECANEVAVFDLDLLDYQQTNNSNVINLTPSFTDYVLENQDINKQQDDELDWNIEIEKNVKK